MSVSAGVEIAYDVPYSPEHMRAIVEALAQAVEENWTLIEEVQHVAPDPFCPPPAPERWMSKLDLSRLIEEDPEDAEDRLNSPPGTDPGPEVRFWDWLPFTFSPLLEDCIDALFWHEQTESETRIGLSLWTKRGNLVIGGYPRRDVWEALERTPRGAFMRERMGLLWGEPLMHRMFLNLVERSKAAHPVRYVKFYFEDYDAPWDEADLAELDKQLRLAERLPSQDSDAPSGTRS